MKMGRLAAVDLGTIMLARAMLTVLTIMLALTPAWAGDAGAATLDLMRGYWRYHFTLSPARIAPEVLAKDVAANAGGLGDWCRKHRIDLSEPFPGAPFYYAYPYAGHGGTSSLTYLIRSAPAPAGWEKVEFDDSVWPRQRLPFLTGDPRFGGWASLSQAVGLACFRARFTVPEPSRVRRLTVKVAFRGGAVVCVNGHEIARTCVPEGEVNAETPGEPYPLRAYVLPPTDVGPYSGQGKNPRPIPEVWGEFPGPGPYIKDRARDCKLPLEDLATFYPHPGGGHVLITRQEWTDLRALRNRTLGPVEVAGRFLRKGVNVLTVAVHRSDFHPVVLGDPRLGTHYGWGYFGGYNWLHGYLIEATLTCSPADATGKERPPAGVQVWADDIHRRYYSPDFGPAEPANAAAQAPAVNPSPFQGEGRVRVERLGQEQSCPSPRPSPRGGEGAAPLRMVGARNGVFSGQAVLATGRPIAQVRAAMSDLTGPAGAVIGRKALEVRFARGHPIADLARLGTDRGGPRWRRPEACPDVHLALARYASALRGHEKDLFVSPSPRAMSEIRFFDHLSTEPPDCVPAGSCQPVWVTLKVPATAAPGEYRGSLSISADGQRLEVPVLVWVMDWRVPDPDRFETVVALEQSPYGVAGHYQVPPWSEDHFRLLEPSLRWLAQVGNDYLVVPVLAGSEFGNQDDAMIRWVKTGEGRYACDFSILDRYLDLAARYLKPRSICVVVCHPTDNNLFVRPRIVLAKEGEEAALLEVPRPGTEEAEALWRPLVEGLRNRLAARGLLEAWHWGYLWDTMDHEKTKGFVLGMMKMLSEMAPGVGWARGAHMIGKGIHGKSPFTFVASIYSLPPPVERDEKTGRPRILSRKGWKNPLVHLSLPRVVNTVITLEGPSSPFSFRLAPERALIAGGRGIGRLGADYWAETYQAGWHGGGQVGMPVTAILWPGPHGAEGSARFECLREGIQEAEARIFLERALEGPAADTPRGRAAQAVLERRIQETLFVPPGSSAPRIAEYCGGWQQRSWDLYAAAAAIRSASPGRASGCRPPDETDKQRFFGAAPNRRHSASGDAR